MPTIKITKPLPEVPHVGIYCRFSSTHAEQLASLSNQVSHFTKMVMGRAGCWIIDIYIDIKSAETVITTRNMNGCCKIAATKSWIWLSQKDAIRLNYYPQFEAQKIGRS